MDADDQCERKADDSQCVTDPRYMLTYCRRTCTQCAPQQTRMYIHPSLTCCYHHFPVAIQLLFNDDTTPKAIQQAAHGCYTKRSYLLISVIFSLVDFKDDIVYFYMF